MQYSEPSNGLHGNPRAVMPAVEVGRRGFLGASVGAAVLTSGTMWHAAQTASAVPGEGPYGSIANRVADRNGVVLPDGFTSRVVATSDSPVGDTSYVWPVFPDGAATFGSDGPDGGWIYVCNSEAVLPGTGGVSAVRFTADGEIEDAYRILEGSTVNCAGGPTPWGTWLSCEEYDWHGNRDATEAFGSVAGRVFETDPTGSTDPVVLPALGLFQHEAAAVDPANECVYMTEDQPDGCLYRFVPDSYPSLGSGRLEVALLEAGTLTWEEVPDPSAASEPTKDQVPGAARFDGGEGLWYHDGTVVFATKGDNRVHAVDAATGAYRVIYDADDLGGDAPLRGVDNLTVEPGSGDVYVAEDGGNMEVVIITPSGEVAPFARVVGHEGSEVTGPVFSPDGSRLYFSSQRGSDGRGVTFEVSGPFRGAVDAVPSETTTTVADSIESASASARTADAGSGGIDPPLVAGAAAAALAAGGIGVLLRRRGRGAVGRGDD